MAGEDEEKTEQPTGKRLSDAREKGQVPISQEVRQWVSLLGVLVVIWLLAPGMASELSRRLTRFIEAPHAIPVDLEGLQALLVQIGLDVLAVLALPLVLLAILGVVGSVGQVGWMFTPSKLAPKLSNISPLAGLKRLFSVRALLELGKGLLKLGVVGIAIWFVMWPMRHDFDLLLGGDLILVLDYLHDSIFAVLTIVAIVTAAMAVGDMAYERWAYIKRLRMTKQEVKDEHKQSEGDPIVKGRIRSLRMQRARERMMAAVPKADVVITNPTHYAVAMKYDMETMSAPVVVAKGMNYLALRIRELAEEHDVTIVENPPLARALYAAVDVDQEIPPEHYRAVAEVIGYVMRLKGRLPR